MVARQNSEILILTNSYKYFEEFFNLKMVMNTNPLSVASIDEEEVGKPQSYFTNN